MVSCDSGHGVRNAIYLINYKILLTKPHSGIAVLMLAYLLPIRWLCHAVVSDHTVSNLSPTTPNHTCNYNINILVLISQQERLNSIIVNIKNQMGYKWNNQIYKIWKLHVKKN